MTIYSLDVLLFLFGTSLLFHVQFELLLPDLHTGFSRGRSGGLVFPSLSECSAVYCDPHSQRLWHTYDLFLQYISKEKLWSHIAILCLIFWETSIFFKSDFFILHPYWSNLRVLISHIVHLYILLSVILVLAILINMKLCNIL